MKKTKVKKNIQLNTNKKNANKKKDTISKLSNNDKDVKNKNTKITTNSNIKKSKKNRTKKSNSKKENVLSTKQIDKKESIEKKKNNSQSKVDVTNLNTGNVNDVVKKDKEVEKQVKEVKKVKEEKQETKVEKKEVKDSRTEKEVKESKTEKEVKESKIEKEVKDSKVEKKEVQEEKQSNKIDNQIIYDENNKNNIELEDIITSKIKKKKYAISDPKIKNYTIRGAKHREFKLTIFCSLIFCLLFFILLFGLFFSIKTEENYNKIKEGSLEVEFSNIDNRLSNIITVTKDNIIDHDDYLKSDVYKFAVSNKSKKKKKYKIIIEDDFEMIHIDECSDRQLSKRRIFYMLDKNTNGRFSDLFNGTEYLLFKGELKSGETRIFNLRIWTDKKADKKAHYHGKIKVLERK